MQIHSAGIPARAGQAHPAAGLRHGGAVAGAADDTAPAPGIDASAERAHGVIRKLQEGHFQGVADVRLRINFADEIQVLQSKAVSQAVEAVPESFLAGLTEAVEAFLSEAEIDPELADQINAAFQEFREAVEAAFDAAPDGGVVDTGGLVVSLESAFQEFLESLEALVPIEAPEAAEGEAPTVAETAPNFAAFVEFLQQSFDESVSALQSDVSTASSSVLPPLSEPNGNGVAYARFVDILRGLSGDPVESPVSVVDAEA